MLIYLCVLPWLAAHAVSQSLLLGTPPTAKGNGDRLRITEGEALTITCPIEDGDVLWYKNDEATSVRSRLYHVPSASRSDSGEYRCLGSNAIGSLFAPTTVVQVQYVDDFSPDADPQRYSVRVAGGGTGVLLRPALLAHEGAGDEASYAWFCDDQEIFSNSSHHISARGDLIITGVRHPMKCRVTATIDTVGEAASRVFDVIPVETDEPFHIVYAPSDRVILLNDDTKPVAVDCVATKAAGLKYRWSVNGAAVSGAEPGVKLEAGDRRLVLSSLSSLGEATVQCQAEATEGRFKDTAAAKITVIKRVSLRPLPAEESRMEGEKLTLRCAAADKQPANYTWWKDGQQIRASSPTGKLQLKKLSKEDFGVYQCDARNAAGATTATVWLKEGEAKRTGAGAGGLGGADKDEEETTSNPFANLWRDVTHTTEETTTQRLRSTSAQFRAIEVSAENDDLIQFGPTNQSILIGTNIEIPCVVSARFADRAEIAWSLNDDPISASGDRALRVSRNRKGGLLIRQAGPDNTGEYRCTVRADGKEENASAWLKIIEKPSMPIAVKAELDNSTVPAQVRVSWREGFDGNSALIRHSVEQRTVGPTGLWSDWETVIDGVPMESCCSVLLDNLKPSVTAEFRVVAANRHGLGKPSLPSGNVTLPQQPPAAAPRSVAAAARSSASVMVQWQPPPPEQWNGDILGYHVRYRLAGYTLPWNEKNVTDGLVRNVAVDQLLTWQEYEIQVAAYNHRGTGVFSKSLYVTTLEGVPTQAPRRVRFEVLNSTAASVAFRAPDQQRIPGVNLGYKVEFWKGHPLRGVLFKQVLVDPNAQELKVTVAHLEKWGHYNLTVLCFTAPGDGPRSEAQTVVTMEDLPGVVGGLGVDQVMFDSAVVVWEQPPEANGDITGYEVRYWANSSPDEKSTMEVGGAARQATVTGLAPSTHYTVEVRASTSVGAGPRSETRFESGVPPELPGRSTGLHITDVEARSVRLDFTPGFDGHTLIRQWIVEARVGDATVYGVVYNTSAPKARHLVVSGLRPHTAYQLRLVAENVRGRGAPSEPSAVFTTRSSEPDAPAARLYAEPVSATAVSLSWTPLLAGQWNGDPKGYLIVYRKKREGGEGGDEEQWKEVRTSSLRATEFTLRDLDPWTEYEVDLHAENVMGRSLSAGRVTATTYEAAPDGAPENVRAEADGSSAMRVAWQAVREEKRHGRVLGYTVRVVPEREWLRGEHSHTVDVDAAEEEGEEGAHVRVTGLIPYTGYQVFVSARTVVGSGPENSVPVLVQTAEAVPGAPSGVSFSLVSENEVRLKWTPPERPNGEIKQYHVRHWRADEGRDSAIHAPLSRALFGFTAAELRPNTRYVFSVAAETAAGVGPEATAVVVTTSVRVPLRVPPPPELDERRPPQSTRLAIAWPQEAVQMQGDDDAPVRSVLVEWQRANEDSWTAASQAVPAAAGGYVITGLSPNTAYRARIRLAGDFAQSPWSAESVWMRTQTAVPGRVRAVRTTPVETSSLQLEWDEMERSSWNADQLGFRLSYSVYPGNATWQSEDVPVSAVPPREHLLTGLQPFRHYIVRVAAMNGDGVGEWSPPAFVYVGYSIPRGNVTGLVAEPTGSSSVSLRWDEWKRPDGEGETGGGGGGEHKAITGFKVRYSPVVSVLRAESDEEGLIVAENNSLIIGDLMKWTEYQISVTPFNRAGEGSSSVLRVRTLEDTPGPVGELVFQDVLLDSVNVSWTAPRQPNGRVTGYVVSYATYKMQVDFKKEMQLTTKVPFLVATQLGENEVYSFTVRAETAAGKGPPISGNVTIGPSKDGPSQPTRPSLQSGQTSVRLQWREGRQGEPVVGHLIQAKRVSKAVLELPLEEIKHRGRRAAGEEKEEMEEERRERRSLDRPNHVLGEWVTLTQVQGDGSSYEVGYRQLEPSSYYVFRVFARNRRGVGEASPESEQLFVPASLPSDPFYTSWWFVALVAMATLVVVVIVIAFLCITGSAAKYKQKARSQDSLHLADGNMIAFQMKPNDRQRSRNDLMIRPGTTTSWISEREPPAYGSMLEGMGGGGGSVAGGGGGSINMYGQLQTDHIPHTLADSQHALNRLSQLAGRDVRGSAYAESSVGDYAVSRSRQREMRSPEEEEDSFDEEERSDDERGYGQYGWQQQQPEMSGFPRAPPPPPLSRPPRPDSSSTGTGSDAWQPQPAPELSKGFSSFV